ncbi:MAG: NAD(P)/FAD-dependent oxidoreductase [Candidatus Thorarchaeota archaeon]|nr:MAG: NAD(P)/FAD-dependent oxidoreductase [Candidatus Thorarchaeota archaeon]
MVKIYDAIIIGGGPAGVSAALHLAFHDRSVLVLDRGTSPMHFHTNSIMNFSGSVYHEGRSLLRKIQGEARAAGAEFKAANVVEVSGRFPKFTIRTAPSYRTVDESEYQSKILLIATGTSRKHPKVDGKWRGWLPIANVGNGAFYCPDCEAPLCKDKEVLIVNAGTVGSALHVANALTRFTDKIQILMTEDAYMPFEKNDLSKLEKSPFKWTSGKIKVIDFPRPGVVQSVTLEDGRKLKANVFFVAFVTVTRSELAQQIGVEVDRNGNILTDHRGKTNIEGVWAAGDVRPITQQVAMAVGTGNYAALMMNQFLGNDYEHGEEFDHPDVRRALHID